MNNSYHHPRSKRLSVVLDMAKRDEKQALQRWADIQKRLSQEQAKSNQLDEYKADYQSHLSAPVQAIISAGNVHNTLDFIGQIDSALKSQNELVAQVESQGDKARQAYLECHKKTEMLIKIVNRLEGEYQRNQSKQEQKEMEEWAATVGRRPN